MPAKIILRHDTAANWVAANPVLSLAELGLETDTGFYKIGDGVTAWNALDYSGLRSPDDVDVLLMASQPTTPTLPSAGVLKLYAKAMGGRILPRILGPSGLSSPLQPSFFQNFIAMINTSATTAMAAIGTTHAVAGTASHPVPTELYGFMTNLISAATAAAQAGVSFVTNLWMRGTLAGGASGFFFAARLAFPDSSYDQSGAATGTRIIVGMSSATTAIAGGSDNPAHHSCAFVRNHSDAGRQDANWQFATRDGATQTLQNTGMPFVPQCVYDAFIFCAPVGNEIGWRIDNVTLGTTAEGTTSIGLPDSTVQMRGMAILTTINAVARNIRVQRLYLEADR